ncbi:hypothetical protein [Ferribacterium limneticum]|uniref:hypothetical protein n=1 Tax=Ferribacterium limneticum TaxID=76259 RepID=UPI001CFB92FF|nr:hypothetical protein [Ferribacterium limneticum]UCV17572.1 hypothetical protein KI610_12115 [Ferribacterium limneticum]
MNKIHLHIDQLSLPGYTPAERRAFIAALEKELVRRTGAVGGQTCQIESRSKLQISTASSLPAAQAAAIGRALMPASSEAKNPMGPSRPPGTDKSR